MSEPLNIPRYLVANIIRGAIHLITNVGWCQHSNHKFDPVTGEITAFCIGGALSEVGRERYSISESGLFEIINKSRDFEEYESFIGFNDFPGRAKQTVIQALEHAYLEVLSGKHDELIKTNLTLAE